MTSSRSALQVIARPQQQSRQCTVQEIHRHAERLQKSGNVVKMLWVPAGEKDFTMGSEAKTEADMLSQLRTGMARINSYLHRIGAAESDRCNCGRAAETMEHFLFRCTKWGTQREGMRQVGQTMMGNLSFFLGGKAASDGPKWTPNLQAVRAAIKFAMDTRRLDANQTR
jgi:hypothetical protein